MTEIPPFVIPFAVFVVAVPLLGWLGLVLGKRTARKNPGFAAALWMLSTFLKIDPPPPPKAERVVKDEGAAGDPPKT